MPIQRVDLDLIAKILRTRSASWNNAKYELDKVEEKMYYDLSFQKEKKDMSKLSHVVMRTYDYLGGILGGGFNFFVKKSFIVDYNVRCNMSKAAEYAEECLSLSFRVNWEFETVVASFYSGASRKVVVEPELKAMIDSNRVKSLTKFAEVTRLNVKDVRETRANEIQELLKVFSTTVSGQHKLTRLIKGCLLYLDHKEKGGQSYNMPGLHVINYTVEGLVRSSSNTDMAYVFTDQDCSNACNWILYHMCESYPNPVMGGVGHVVIPRDGAEIRLVGYQLTESAREVHISPELIWGTLVSYANSFKLHNDLECALAIACSLRQNRFLKRIRLPKVVSGIDLVYPVLSNTMEGVADKIYMSSECAVMMGRAHQVMMAMLLKEVHCSCASTSALPNEVYRRMRSVISIASHNLIEYMEHKCVVDLLKITGQMVWLSALDDSGIENILSKSAFEGIWMVRYTTDFLYGGVLASMNNGMKRGININQVGIDIDKFAILRSEIVKGGGTSMFTMPNGSYHVSFACMRGCQAHA